MSQYGLVRLVRAARRRAPEVLVREVQMELLDRRMSGLTASSA